jgi:hypothetical protein
MGLLESFGNGFHIGQIAFNKLGERVNCEAMALAQVVKHHDIVTGLD